jgi:hypothetical protein
LWTTKNWSSGFCTKVRAIASRHSYCEALGWGELLRNLPD